MGSRSLAWLLPPPCRLGRRGVADWHQPASLWCAWRRSGVGLGHSGLPPGGAAGAEPGVRARVAWEFGRTVDPLPEASTRKTPKKCVCVLVRVHVHVCVCVCVFICVYVCVCCCCALWLALHKIFKTYAFDSGFLQITATSTVFASGFLQITAVKFKRPKLSSVASFELQPSTRQNHSFRLWLPATYSCKSKKPFLQKQEN